MLSVMVMMPMMLRMRGQSVAHRLRRIGARWRGGSSQHWPCDQE
jgi:hypothetical protein